jgi:hypothetical protein
MEPRQWRGNSPFMTESGQGDTPAEAVESQS